MKLAELITKNPEKDPVEIAKLALRQDREGVIIVVAAEVERQRRAQVRSAERSIIGPMIEATAGSPKVPSQAKIALTKTFKTSQGGAPIQWQHATIEDHQARIDFLRVHIAGCERTVRYHEEAIKQIENAGVSCLAEIPETKLDPVEVDEQEVATAAA